MELARVGQRLIAARGRLLPARTMTRVAANPGSPRRLIEELLAAHQVLRADYAAELWGVAPLEAALALRLTTAEAVAEALARRIGAIFTLFERTQPVIAADPDAWRQVLHRGTVGIDREVGGKSILLAPRAAEAEAIAADPTRFAMAGWPLVVTTPDRFEALIRGWAEAPWSDEAIFRLADEEPDRSAGDSRTMKRAAFTTFAALACLGLCLVAGPSLLAFMAGGIIGLSVVLWMAIRLAAAALPVRPLPRRPLSDAELPRYTLLCPLYREERVADLLLAALARLDYPHAKLDIRLILEEDDPETLAVVRAATAAPPFTVMVLPPAGPRTKPKALMMALPFARGEMVAVYDAEDRPGRGQLREAAETFAAADARLGCLQAPLSIANADDTWLTRLFTAEYDALFRVLLPAFARFDLPMPLGGTSNHFRMTALRQSLGWDPYNVTEDADLGFRLARNGWRIGTIMTPTEEEAPPSFAGWLGQRSRWFKGWLQTLAVLVQAPRRVAAELGWKGLVALAMTLAGSLGSALVHLICVGALGATLWIGGWPAWSGVALATFVIGYAGSAAYMAVGLRRAGHGRLAGWLALLPLAWIVMGFAALRGVWQLARRPYHWDKTAHGLSRAWLAAAGVPGEQASDGIGDADTRIADIIARSEQLLTSGVHDAATIAEALERARLGLADRGASSASLARLDAHLAGLAGRYGRGAGASA